MSVLFDTINDAGKLSAQMSPLISTAIDQVEDIIATFNRTGSSSGDLDVSGNVPSNLLQTLRQMVSVAGKFAATLTNGVKAVKSIQAQPKSLFATSSVGGSFDLQKKKKKLRDVNQKLKNKLFYRNQSNCHKYH